MQRRTALTLFLVPLVTPLGIRVRPPEIRWVDFCRLGEDILWSSVIARSNTAPTTAIKRARARTPIKTFLPVR